MNFREYWKKQNLGLEFEKARLNKTELQSVHNRIANLQKKGWPSSKIISAIQKMNSKLSERWKAERVYWTEVKRDDTTIVGDAGDDLGIDKYTVILSPNACKTCIKKSDNGRKIFKTSDITKGGYGHVPPFHPNCYCILVPRI